MKFMFFEVFKLKDTELMSYVAICILPRETKKKTKWPHVITFATTRIIFPNFLDLPYIFRANHSCVEREIFFVTGEGGISIFPAGIWTYGLYLKGGGKFFWKFFFFFFRRKKNVWFSAISKD